MKLLRTIRQRIRGDQEAGSMSVELVILAPAIAFVILFLVVAGRVSMAGNATEAAAISAAREASLSRSTDVAQSNANAAAQVAMSQAGYDCASLTVTINDGGLNVPLGQVGTVSATISCTLNLSDIALPGLPGTKTLTSTAISPVDAYRERP